MEQRPAAGRRADPDIVIALVRGRALATAVPDALALVERFPLASAGWFAGDVLRGLMEVPGGFWGRHPDLYDRYRTALRAGAEARRRLPAGERMVFWSALDVSVVPPG